MALRDLDVEVDVEVDGSELVIVNQQVDDLVDTLEKLDKVYDINIDLDDGNALVQIEKLEQKLREIDNRINIHIDLDTFGEITTLEAVLSSLEHERINVKVDLDITDAESRIAMIEAELQALAATSINIDVDTTGAMAQIAVLQSQIAALNMGSVDINIDSASLQAQIIILQAQLDALNNNPPDVDIHVQAADAIVELQRIQNRVDNLDGDDIFIDVDIDTLSNDILALRAQIQYFEASGINLNIDTAAAHAQLAAMQAHLQALQIQANAVNVGPGMLGMFAGFNPVGFAVGAGIFLAVLGAILTILPPLAIAINVVIGAVGVLGVALGVLGGAALALGSALVVGAAGLMGFGAIAISSIVGLYDEKAKLTASQRELKAETDKVIKSWQGLKTALEPAVFDAAKSGVKAINTLLEQSQPILKKAGGAVGDLLGNFNKSLKGNEMQSFFSMLKQDIGPITTNLGNGFGNALKGVANTMTALSPLTRWVSQGFENMMGSFANWTSGLIGSNKMETFMDYIKTNAPKIGSALGHATTGITKFFAGFSGVGSDAFTWFQDKMVQFDSWASGLGNNAGFQNFLDGIRENAPVVGDILRELGGSLKTFWTIMTDDTGGASRLESFASGLKHLGNALKDQNLQDVISGAFTFDMSKIVGGLTGGAQSGGFGAVEGQIEKNVSETFKNGILKGITNGATNLSATGLVGKALNGLIGKMFGGSETTSEPLPAPVIDNMVQGAMTQVENAMNGTGGSLAYSKELSLFKGTEVKLDVAADTTKAEQQVEQVASAKEIQAKVDADTAAAQSKLNALDATPIKISTDTSAISAQIGSMAATIQLNANTSAIRNEIQNMPNANIKLTADKASLQNSISNLDANVTLKAKKIDITNNLVQPVNLPITPIMQKTDHLFGGAPATMEVTPKITKMPKLDPISVDVKLNVNNSAIGNLSAGIKVTFPPMPKFNWPPLPKFSWPPLPKFSWPPMPKFSWPPLPKWSWPAYPKFSWPPMPKFSWPPMPTVKVNVSGAANGSHASGLGRVPFDNYVGNLHKDESVLTAVQSDQLRSIGALKGNGESPELDMSAIANYNPASASSNPKASVARTSNSKTSNTTNHYTINVQVDGSKSPEQTGASVVEQLQNWVASMEDANPAVYEF